MSRGKREEEKQERRRGRGQKPVWTSVGWLLGLYTPPHFPPSSYSPSSSSSFLWLRLAELFLLLLIIMCLLSPGTSWIHIPQKCKRIHCRVRARRVVVMTGWSGTYGNGQVFPCALHKESWSDLRETDLGVLVISMLGISEHSHILLLVQFVSCWV